MNTKTVATAACVVITALITGAGCVTIQGDTTYAGTYVSNQKDSKAVNVSGSNGNNVYREAQDGRGISGGEDQATPNGTQGKGAQVVIAGQDINQQKQADTRAVASLQQGNKGAGAAGGDESTTNADGGATNVAPTVNATGQGAASSGDANNDAGDGDE